MSKKSSGAMKRHGVHLHPSSFATAPNGDPLAKRALRLDHTEAGVEAAQKELRFLKKKARKAMTTLPQDMPLGERMLQAARRAEELLEERMGNRTLALQPSS